MSKTITIEELFYPLNREGTEKLESYSEEDKEEYTHFVEININKFNDASRLLPEDMTVDDVIEKVNTDSIIYCAESLYTEEISGFCGLMEALDNDSIEFPESDPLGIKARQEMEDLKADYEELYNKTLKFAEKITGGSEEDELPF